MGKTGTIERFIWKKIRNMGFSESLIEAVVKFRFVLHRYIFRELKN
jgi:hypothetical protein